MHGLSAGYGFNSKDQKGNDLSDFYRAELNYKFNSLTNKKDFFGSLFVAYKDIIFLLYNSIYIVK